MPDIETIEGLLTEARHFHVDNDDNLSPQSEAFSIAIM